MQFSLYQCMHLEKLMTITTEKEAYRKENVSDEQLNNTFLTNRWNTKMAVKNFTYCSDNKYELNINITIKSHSFFDKNNAH